MAGSCQENHSPLPPQRTTARFFSLALEVAPGRRANYSNDIRLAGTWKRMQIIQQYNAPEAWETSGLQNKVGQSFLIQCEKCNQSTAGPKEG